MKKQILKSALMAMAGVGLITVNASAYSFTGVTYDNTAIYDIPAVSNYTTYDDMMIGMGVTITWRDGVVNNLVWSDLGGGFSGVSTRNVTIRLNGDSFDTAWSVDNTTISNLAISKITSQVSGLAQSRKNRRSTS